MKNPQGLPEIPEAEAPHGQALSGPRAHLPGTMASVTGDHVQRVCPTCGGRGVPWGSGHGGLPLSTVPSVLRRGEVS